MTTIEELREDMRIALRLGNKLEVEVLRGIISAAQKTAIDKRCEITVGLIDEVLVKEQKTIQEMIDSCPESRTELLKEYKNRKKIIDYYAPVIVSNPVEVRSMVEQILVEAEIDLKTANKGQIMKIIMPKIKGKVDMKVANQCITELLNQYGGRVWN